MQHQRPGTRLIRAHSGGASAGGATASGAYTGGGARRSAGAPSRSSAEGDGRPTPGGVLHRQEDEQRGRLACARTRGVERVGVHRGDRADGGVRVRAGETCGSVSLSILSRITDPLRSSALGPGAHSAPGPLTRTTPPSSCSPARASASASVLPLRQH
jgi:hypothetical protein